MLRHQTLTLDNIILTGDLRDLCDFSWTGQRGSQLVKCLNLNRIIFGRNNVSRVQLFMFPPVEGEGGLRFSHKWPTLKQWQLHWNLIICSYLTGHPGNASEELMGNKQMRASGPPAKPRVELQWSVDSSQRDLSSGKLSSQRTLQSGRASP